MKAKQIQKQVYFALGDASNGLSMGDHYKTYREAMIGISAYVKK